MTDDRWRRIKALFQATVERPSAERDAFLAEAVGGDDALRQEVESLLASDAADSGALDRLPLAAGPLLADPVPLPIRTRVGPYEIVAAIGHGAMGEVYRARDTKLNREVALKVLPPLFALDPDRVARFRREAQVLAAVNHPNIAAIYDFEESDGVQALVLELVDGQTLADHLEQGPLPVTDALTIARQVAAALEAAHEKGIIHRDLKPANIQITITGAVKVLDFGLAKAFEGAPDVQQALAPTLTATLDRERAMLGTPAYMSPEQARGRTLDKRTDIWSFGCVLFETLTGRAAFADETISDTIARVLDRDVDWDALPAETPARVRDLLRRCLQKDVRKRLRDIGDGGLELEDAMAPSTETTDPVVARQIRRRRMWQFAAGVMSAAMIVVATAYLTERGRAVPLPAFRQLTFRHGAISGARLAPDGKTVVYRATWTGAQPELFLIRPESLQSGSLGLLNAGIYSVSSRGDLAVALGCRLNWGKCLGTLAAVPIAGGSPREMVKDVLDADWSPDGQRMAVVLFAGDSYRLHYPIDKILYEAPGWITDARVSPKADRVAFLDHDRLGDTGGSVTIVDLNGQKTRLSADWKSLHGLAWSGSGEEIWFAGSRRGTSSSALYAVTLSGRERTVLSSPGTLKLNDISHDGRQVLLTRGATRGGIIGLGRDGKERDLSWLDFSTVADLSADGMTLLFYEWGEGVGAMPTVFLRRTDGSDAVRLGSGRPLALSPDARWVVAVQDTAPQQLVLLPAGTGELKPLPRGPIVEYFDWAAWSIEGRRIFFAGRESGNVRRTYVQDADGGDPRAVTPDGFVGMLLSPDGKNVMAVDRYGEYYVCAIGASTAPRPLAGYQDGDVPLQWSADGRFLYVREAGNLALRIYRLDVTTGARQLWKALVPPDPAVLIDIGSDPGQVRITPDGTSYAYTYWTFDGELYLAEGLK
jgi:eukaryotic-like serine/threonine-protein kinase